VGEDAVTVEARTPARPRQEATASSNIYIKGLREGTTEAEVLDAVAGFGPVASTEVVSDRAENRGFAFVAFESVDAATAAVESGGISVAGIVHSVEYRMSKPRSKKGRRRKKAPTADQVTD
jgi:hypothetical protein